MNIVLKGKKRIYRITADTRQYILSEEKIVQKSSNVSKKGDIYYTEVGYIPNLISVFNKLLELEIKDSDATTLLGLKKAHTEALEWLKKEFKGIQD